MPLSRTLLYSNIHVNIKSLTSLIIALCGFLRGYAGRDDWRRVYGGVWPACTQRDATRAGDFKDGYLAAQCRQIFQDPTSTARPTQTSHRYPFRYI